MTTLILVKCCEVNCGKTIGCYLTSTSYTIKSDCVDCPSDEYCRAREHEDMFDISHGTCDQCLPKLKTRIEEFLKEEEDGKQTTVM